jgi:hypothetical protein
MFTKRLPGYVLWALFGALLPACGGGGAPAGAGSAPAADASVQERLDALGATQDEGPRLDENGDPLPEAYSPLGTRRRMGVSDSIGLVGWSPAAGAPSTYRLATFGVIESDPTQLTVAQEVLSADAQLRTSSVLGSMPLARHAACGIDVDSDALDEQVIAYLADGSAADSQVRVRVFTPAKPDAAASERDELLLDEAVTILDLHVASGDVDGDGIPELILGYSTLNGGVVRVATFENGSFVLAPFSRTLPPVIGGATVTLEFEAGQLDRDAGQELALVRNEFMRAGNSWYEPVATTCMVWDDFGVAFAILLDEPLVVDDGGVPYQAVVGDVALGDLDADGMDEVAFAGVYSNATLNVGRYVARAYDDLSHELVVLSEHRTSASVGQDGNGIDEADDAYVNFVHVDIVDFEGDSVGEIHLNEVVYLDWQKAEAWTKWLEIPAWFPQDVTWSTYPDRIDQSNTAMVKGDFDGDGREDLAVWASRRPGIGVWGIDTRDAPPTFGKLVDVPLPESAYDADEFLDANPVLFRATLDDEASLVEFVEHQVFTSEPVVLAVIAAPPTLGRDQNLDGSETAYGESSSSSTSNSAAVGFSFGFVVGSEFELWGNGWEVEVQMKNEWGSVFEASEQRTESVSYSTGWSEDSVVCTVESYDRYVYRVIAHPNPDAIGQLVSLDVPRGSAQTFQVERTFYNENIARSATRVGPEVLGHTIGDPQSYPSVAERDQLVAMHDGMYTDPQPVSQGEQGARRVTLTIATNTTATKFVTAAFDFEATTTVATIKLGGTFSASKTAEWSVSYGDETSFEGAVGSLHAAAFIAHSYSFGLLAYWHTDENNRVGYQVVTYYVPRTGP